MKLRQIHIIVKQIVIDASKDSWRKYNKIIHKYCITKM